MQVKELKRKEQEILSNRGMVKYMYLSDIHRTDIMYTLCFVADENTVRLGLARKGPKDQFCRKIGRAIALGRALNPRTCIELPLDSEDKVYPSLDIKVINAIGEKLKNKVKEKNRCTT